MNTTPAEEPVNMRSWLAAGPDASECLYRSGAGLVSAVYPAPGRPDHHVVEILAVPPVGRMKALRYVLSPVISTDDPNYPVAVAAARDTRPVRWRVRWQRHPWVNTVTPVTALNLEADVVAVLEQLAIIPTEEAEPTSTVPHDSEYAK